MYSCIPPVLVACTLPWNRFQVNRLLQSRIIHKFLHVLSTYHRSWREAPRWLSRYSFISSPLQAHATSYVRSQWHCSWFCSLFKLYSNVFRSNRSRGCIPFPSLAMREEYLPTYIVWNFYLHLIQWPLTLMFWYGDDFFSMLHGLRLSGFSIFYCCLSQW